MEDFKMTPIACAVMDEGSFERGKNMRIIRKFVNSGENAVRVEDKHVKPVCLYQGLRRAVLAMGLNQSVYVQMQGNGINLIRVR